METSAKSKINVSSIENNRKLAKIFKVNEMFCDLVRQINRRGGDNRRNR